MFNLDVGVCLQRISQLQSRKLAHIKNCILPALLHQLLIPAGFFQITVRLPISAGFVYHFNFRQFEKQSSKGVLL